MKISLWRKITVCLLAGTMGVCCIHSDISHYLALGIPDAVISIPALILFCGAIIFIPLWQWLENKQKLDSNKALAFWQGVIIYLEAFVFFRFGLLKLFDLHMQTSLVSSDFPASSISDYQLLNYFFGRAPAFKLIIGSIQLIGAVAMLFRRTRLISIFILLPVIVNIVCMDLLYDVGGGITITAILLFAGLIYLMLQEKEKLIQLFLKSDSAMPGILNDRKTIKNLLRASVLFIPLLILLPSVTKLKNKSIIGKYNVTSLNINNKQLAIDLNNDSLLTTVYFDENQTCVLRYNDYRKIKIGKAIYDDSNERLNVLWRYPDTQKGESILNLSKSNINKERSLSGTIGSDTIKATLVKTELPGVVLK